MKIDSLELTLTKTESKIEKIHILLELSESYINSNPNKALEYADDAWELSQEIDSEEEILMSAIKLAEAYSNLSEYSLANKFALKARDYAQNLGDPMKIAQVKIVLANLHLTFYNLETSMGLFYESLIIFEEIGSKRGIATALNGIGIIYHEQNNFEKALESFLKCYDINKEIGNNAVLSATINNIASAYSKGGQNEKSILYYKEAIEMNKEFGNKYLEITGYYNLGESYLEMGKYEESIKYFRKAIQVSSELEDVESSTNIKTAIAEYYLITNQPDSSILFANEAFSMADQYQFKQYAEKAASILYMSFEEKGDFEKAFKYAIVQSDLKDSLKIEQSIQKMANLELKYRIEKEEQERLFALEKKEAQQKVMIIIAVFIIIIVIILFIARQRIAVNKIRLEKSKVESKLEMRNKELAVNVMTLLKKNDLLTSISKDLIEVKSQAVRSETKDAINKISRKVKKSSESEIWKEFELRFKEVHSEFYETLTEEFPELSPGEQRLCALLKLNLSSKEIAELTGQSINTLEKARYRLRKKLNISDPSVNLINYLSGL